MIACVGRLRHEKTFSISPSSHSCLGCYLPFITQLLTWDKCQDMEKSCSSPFQLTRAKQKQDNGLQSPHVLLRCRESDVMGGHVLKLPRSGCEILTKVTLPSTKKPPKIQSQKGPEWKSAINLLPPSHQSGVSPGKGVALLRCAGVLWFIPSFLFLCSLYVPPTSVPPAPDFLFHSSHKKYSDSGLPSSLLPCVYMSVYLLFPAFQVLCNGLLEMTSGFPELKVKECSCTHFVQFVWLA